MGWCLFVCFVLQRVLGPIVGVAVLGQISEGFKLVSVFLPQNLTVELTQLSFERS